MSPPSVLFVCLGNICRSPLAETALRDLAARAGQPVMVDSAGTASYHVGEPPDPRSIAEAARHGIDIAELRGRQLMADDFRRFDWIVGMDASNMRNIERVRPPDGTAQIALLLDLVPGRTGEDVADPWYGGPEGFVATWADVSAGVEALLAKLR